MTGRSRSGKMSIRMRLTANAAVRATAITATSTVIGRRSAARMSHMHELLGLPEDGEEGTEIALCDRRGQQCAPDLDARELILHFRLREQALGVGHFDDGCEAGVVARAGLPFAL